MVDVLDSSLHNEQFPAEIDVYKVPHNRMKQLVSSITKTLPEIQECLNYESQSLEDTLETMYTIILELKNHEIIENTVIMKRLRERLLARQIHNHSVCSCHEDSDLLNIIDLLETVYSSSRDTERNFYWQKLQEALYEFLEDFLPHMEEEENTFQPLLNEYFNYDELRQIKDTVITQHQEWKENLSAEKSLKRFKMDSDIQDSQIVVKKRRGESLSDHLPDEIIIKIFGYFEDPRDSARAGQVCKRWNSVWKSAEFWRSLPLSQWERQLWTWSSVDLFEMIQAERKYLVSGENEDNSFYENIAHFLEDIGHNVKQLSVSGSNSIQNLALKHILKRTPNIRELDCSYTNIGRHSFDGSDIRLPHLLKLDLSGCANVSDDCIRLIADKIPCKSVCLRWLSLSGCEQITGKSLEYLEKFSSTLEHIDLSGCFRMPGSSIKVFTDRCKNLNLEKLSYCSLIEDGPAPGISNGCQNLDCGMRYCCEDFNN